jgi:hypothetical protein
MEAVIADLESDTTLEIASGVAQLNYKLDQVQSDLKYITTGGSRYIASADVSRSFTQPVNG